MRILSKLFILGFFVTTVAACASHAWMDENLDKYQGKLTYAQAIQKWGDPDSDKRLENGNRVVRWTHIQSMILPYSGPTYRPSGSYYYTPYLNTPMERDYERERLIVTFDKNDVLRSWDLQ